MCTNSDKFAIRQMFVLSAQFLISISFGFVLSFPAVLNPSILSPNSTIYVTSNEASWIASCNGFSGILGFFILSPLFQLVGRKYVNFSVALAMLTGWVIIFFSRSAFALLCGRIIQGMAVGAYFIGAITISEYCDPKRRGIYMSVKKLSVGMGSLICHSLVLIFDWRSIAAFAAGPSILAAFIMLFWPESPAFLAMKGRFSECEKSFVWLNGNSAQKMLELNDLINTQTERLDKKKESSSILIIAKIFRKLRRKDFLKPFFIVSLLSIALDASGRYFLLAYLTQIVVEVTGNKSFARYCTISSDFLIIFALSASCFLIRSFKRRTILFLLGPFVVILMFTISFVLVLQTHFGFIKDYRWLIPSIILMHSFVSHIGLVPVSFAICSEIFPLEHKGLGSCLSGIVFTVFYALCYKLTPLMIESTGVEGTYAIYGTCVVICLVLLYKLVPETKDKTLQEIEHELKGFRRTLERNVLI